MTPPPFDGDLRVDAIPKPFEAQALIPELADGPGGLRRRDDRRGACGVDRHLHRGAPFRGTRSDRGPSRVGARPVDREAILFDETVKQ